MADKQTNKSGLSGLVSAARAGKAEAPQSELRAAKPGAGMTADDFRAMALALPEAVEAPHFDRASFRVGKKIFATMAADGSDGMVPVKNMELLNSLLASHPEGFFSFGAWTERKGYLGVRLAGADPALVRELMTEAWAGMAPQRALKALKQD